MIDYGEMISRGMTADELRVIREQAERKPYEKKGRYGNVAKRTEYNGVKYDSKMEAEYAGELDLMIQGGLIVWWLRQVTIPLGPDFRTRVDFLVARRHPQACWVDIYAVEVKGVETREFAKVRKLWPKYGPFKLHVNKRRDVEIIHGK